MLVHIEPMYIDQANALKIKGCFRTAYHWIGKSLKVCNIDIAPHFCIIMYRKSKIDNTPLVEIREAIPLGGGHNLYETKTIAPSILKSINEMYGYGLETIEMEGRLLFKCQVKPLPSCYTLFEKTKAATLLAKHCIDLGIYSKFPDSVKTVDDARTVGNLLIKVGLFKSNMDGSHNEVVDGIHRQMKRCKDNLARFDAEIRETYNTYMKNMAILKEFGVEHSFPLFKEEV